MYKRIGRNIPLGEIIRSLAPITPLGRAMLAGVVIWLLNWIFSDGRLMLGSRQLKILVDFASLLALVPFAYFIFHYSGSITSRLLWRLRRRLVVNYLLIGVIPIALLVLLIVLIGYVVVMQAGANLVSRQLDAHLEQSHSAALSLGRDFANAAGQGRMDTAETGRRLQEKADSLAPVFPRVRAVIFDRASGEKVAADSALPAGEEPEALEGTGGGEIAIPEAPLPSWLKEEFHGLVVLADSAGRRHVYALHLVPLRGAPGYSLELSYPIGERLCRRLSQNTELEVRPGMAMIPLVMTSSGPGLEQSGIRRIEEGGRAGDSAAGRPGRLPVFKEVRDWVTGASREVDVLMIDSSFLLPGEIWRRIEQFRASSVLGDAIVWTIGGLSVFFLIIILTAVVSAIVLTRSITGAIHNLYLGTKRVEEGDLSHEIPIISRDQVGDLSVSFNQMTRSIRELMRVSAEKQRLDQEMRIAAQVQAQLFPKAIPVSRRLEFAPGKCIPARSVSGDYYDFLEVAPGCIGIVVADVCGKGVSAALMMANLQANLRGQVLAYYDSLARQADAADIASLRSRLSPVRKIVERVNLQIADSMMDSSFITFFYGEFDERSCMMTYTNAGHNPPLLLRHEEGGTPVVERLEAGGTVLGLFKDSRYEDARIELRPGDLLVAFTDGLLEANNRLNEEYGEENLVRCIIRNRHLSAPQLEAAILESVRAWTEGAEQEDDLTLVIFKVR